MQQENVIQVLNDPLAKELLTSAIPVRLAYTGSDGFPRVVPVGFYWNGAVLEQTRKAVRREVCYYHNGVFCPCSGMALSVTN